jgi:hypothetical protein
MNRKYAYAHEKLLGATEITATAKGRHASQVATKSAHQFTAVQAKSE